MKILAIECATEACSVALFDGDHLVAGELRMLGRGHAEHLVPMIAELPDKGRAQRIVVSLGPGSFTGVRIGLAAARALALAWKCEVLGYPTLALVAAMARGEQSGAVSVCMTGGHGEWFMQDFGADGVPETSLQSLVPADAVAAHEIVVGTQAEAFVKAQGHGTAVPCWPDARDLLRLPAPLFTADLTPIYGRAPDARLPA